MATEVKVPALGESITEAVVMGWLVQPGDAIALDQDLVELETDKVTVNVPSPVAGVLVEQRAKEGDEVEIGTVIALIDESASAPAAEASETKAPEAKAPAAPEASAEPGPAAEPQASREPAAAPEASPGERPSAGPPVDGAPLMPAVRRLIDEHGLSPSVITGTGRGGRILKEDVLAYLDARKPAGTSARPTDSVETRHASQAPAPLGAAEEVVRMTKLRRTIAERLVQAQRTAAILTTFNEVDMSAVMALRRRYRDAFEEAHGVRLGFVSFFAKAAIEALKAFPSVNAEIRGEDIVYKNYFHIGVAVGGGRGLVVPVVKHADQLSFADFERTLASLADKARDNRLSLEELTGGTFTISNGGVYGSLLSTPILNPPQTGILGLHKIEQRPVAIDGKVEIRPMMYLALSYDHRLVDGREAVSFLVRVKECVEDPSRILIEV